MTRSLRPADAVGLPFFPGVVRFPDVGEYIGFTAPVTQRSDVWPVDDGWENDVLPQLRDVPGPAFEAARMVSWTINSDSGATSYP